LDVFTAVRNHPIKSTHPSETAVWRDDADMAPAPKADRDDGRRTDDFVFVRGIHRADPGSGIQRPLAISIIAGLIIRYPFVLLGMPVLIGLTQRDKAASHDALEVEEFA
jgi:hypothetical protein